MLTRKQYELLMYIDHHLKQTGFSPSFEEMKDALKLKSKSGIHRLISALEERGFLGRRRQPSRPSRGRRSKRMTTAPTTCVPPSPPIRSAAWSRPPSQYRIQPC